MSFSFNATAGASQSTAKPNLKGGDIYSINFVGCESRDIQGVKDTSMVYKVLDLKFENEDGRYVHTVFEPKEADFKRKENEITNKNGQIEKIPQPSNVEAMMLLFKHLIDSVNPKVGQKIDSGEMNLTASSWDQLRELICKILAEPAKNKVATNIKLVTNTRGEASFPFFAGLTKEGKAYVKNNFIGNKLAFTPYELQKIKAAATANPTPTNDFASISIEETNEPAEDIEFNFEVGDLKI